MKVLLVAPYAFWTPHLETDLELLQNHVQAGDEVVLLRCMAELSTCDVNSSHDFKICHHCQSRMSQGLEMIDGAFRSSPLLRLTEEDHRGVRGLPRRFESVDALKNFHVDNFEIGWAVLSSVISVLKEPRPDPSVSPVHNLMARFTVSAYVTYCSVKNWLESEPFDRVYVFNARFSVLRAVLRASQRCGVQCFNHDRGHDLQHYSLFPDVMGFDLENLQILTQRAWNSAPVETRSSVASSFFQDRAEGKDLFHFVKNQDPCLMPTSWDERKWNIVVYLSSEDETAALGDSWNHPLYEDQLEGMTRLVQSLSSDDSIHLYVRVHPRLADIQNSQTEWLKELRGPNLTVIDASSPISSYLLLHKCDVVATFGSTVGIEATYWGKPSVLMHSSFYQKLDATYSPRSHEDVVSLLTNRTLAPKPQESALPYGYYEQTYGIRYQHYEGIGVNSGKFRGRELQNLNPWGLSEWQFYVRPWKEINLLLSTLRRRWLAVRYSHSIGWFVREDS